MTRHPQQRRKHGLWACCCTAAALLATQPPTVWAQQSTPPAATAAAASAVVPLKRIDQAVHQPQPGTDKQAAASPSLRGATNVNNAKQPAQDDTGAIAALSSVSTSNTGGYYAVLEFEGEQRLLALVDTASPSLSVPILPAATPPATTTTSAPAASKAPPPPGVDCSSQHPGGMSPMSRGWGLELQAAKAKPVQCSDDRCVGTCVPHDEPAPGSNGGCSPLGGSCNGQKLCSFEWGGSIPTHPFMGGGGHMPPANSEAAGAQGGVLMEANVRVGGVSVTPATFGVLEPSSMTGDGMMTSTTSASSDAVLGLSFGNYSLCPPHTTCTRPLLDQLLEQQQPGAVVQDRFALCMDGEVGALVLGRGDRRLAKGGAVSGPVPLVEPYRHYWVGVMGLRLGNASIAPELFYHNTPEADASSSRPAAMDRDNGEGCANSTSTAAASLAGNDDRNSSSVTAVKQEEGGGGGVPSWVRQPGGGPGQWGVVSRALLDTGRDDVRLPAPLFDALRRHCEDNPAHREALPALAGTRTYNLFDGFAVRISDEELSRMPALEVALDRGVALVLPPSRYLRLSQVVVDSNGDGSGGNYYSLRLGREDHFVLGLAALEGHYLEVDRAARTLSVGLAQPTCQPAAATP